MSSRFMRTITIVENKQKHFPFVLWQGHKNCAWQAPSLGLGELPVGIHPRNFLMDSTKSDIISCDSG